MAAFLEEVDQAPADDLAPRPAALVDAAPLYCEPPEPGEVLPPIVCMALSLSMTTSMWHDPQSLTAWSRRMTLEGSVVHPR
jgi:hypothetical protein